ncbi:MAG: FMN reductase, partial [Mesorhizobium sp.]
VELQMAPVKSAVHIAWGDFLAVRQGEKKLEELEHLNQAATALVNDVAWWAKVLKAARQADAVAEEVKAA